MVEPKHEDAVQEFAWKVYWAVKDLKRDCPALRKSEIESMVATAVEAVYAMGDEQEYGNVVMLR